MRRIDKSFPGVDALRNVDFDLQAGEVHALLGENGAGKSTLIKILGGGLKPDHGEIRIRGRDPEITSPAEAQRAGIAVIYQEFNLIPALSVRENIFLGRDHATWGWLRHREELLAARQIFDRMGVSLDGNALCSSLSVAQQQLVEIAKALALDATILVMDEPSAALTTQEVDHLFAIVRELQGQGIGIIYISHRLEEIESLADRVTVLRDGQKVATRLAAETDRNEMIELMVGRTLDKEFPPRNVTLGDTRLRVERVSAGDRVRDVSFTVRAGEILGITGLVGAGRTELARAIFGADPRDTGTIALDGTTLHIDSPRDAIRAGIGFLTEDRKLQGLVLKHSVRHNYGLPNLSWLSRIGWVRQQAERSTFGNYIDNLRIKIPAQDQLAATLSGGNQQKVVLAKWLARQCDVLLFDEPTRGIDVGAKYEIYLLMNRLAEEGKSVVMISSELPEILGMSDRILVMRDGSMAGEVTDVKGATQEQLLDLALA